MSGSEAASSAEQGRDPPRATRRLLLVVGARPNFVKAGPVLHAARADGRCDVFLVHTGQHYDANLSDRFFQELALPEPDVSLGVGSGTHAVQTAEVMRRLEPILREQSPDCVVVFGDVNSTVAAALTAAKLQLPVAHVEAGLRSFDPSMPEEINRRVTDCLSDLLFTTEESGNRNLAREGVPEERVHFVGNTMVDSLMTHLEQARRRRPAVLDDLGGGGGEYALLTLHRPANVDRPETFGRILEAVTTLSRRLPVIFPVHPRTRRRLAESGPPDGPGLAGPGLACCDPLPYLDFLSLLDGARLVLTDSGGIQEETTVLGTPCLTLRENTERPVTLTHGTNRLVGSDPAAILSAARAILEVERPEPPAPPPLWDGRAAERIVPILVAGVGG